MEGLSERQASILEGSIGKIAEVLDNPAGNGWSLVEKYGTTELLIKPVGNLRLTCFKDTLPCNAPIAAAYEFLRDVRSIPIVSPVSESIEVVAKAGVRTRFIHMVLKAFFPYPRRKACFLCRNFVQDGNVPFVGLSMISNGPCDYERGGDHLPSFEDGRETMNVAFIATVLNGRTQLVAILQKTTLMAGCGSSLAQILPRELADKLDFRFRLWLIASIVGRMRRGIELFQRGEIWWQKDDVLMPGLHELYTLGERIADLPVQNLGPVAQIPRLARSDVRAGGPFSQEPPRDEAMAKADEMEALARDLEDKLSLFAFAAAGVPGQQAALGQQYSALHEKCLRISATTIARLEEQLARIVVLQQSPLDLVQEIEPRETLAQRQAAVAAGIVSAHGTPPSTSANSPMLPEDDRLAALLSPGPPPHDAGGAGPGPGPDVPVHDALAMETARVQGEIEMLKRRHSILQQMRLTAFEGPTALSGGPDDTFTKRPRWAAQPLSADPGQPWAQPHSPAPAPAPAPAPLPPISGGASRAGRGAPSAPPAPAVHPQGFPFSDPEPTLFPAPMACAPTPPQPPGSPAAPMECSTSTPTLSLPPLSPALPPLPVDSDGNPALGPLDPYALLAAFGAPGEAPELYEALSPDPSVSFLDLFAGAEEVPGSASAFSGSACTPRDAGMHLPPASTSAFGDPEASQQLHPLSLPGTPLGLPHPGQLIFPPMPPIDPLPPAAAEPPEDRFSALPPSLLIRILASLSLADRAACARVCRSLRAAAASDALWLPTLHVLFGPDADKRCGRKIAPGTPAIALFAARRRAELNWRAGRLALSSPCVCSKTAGKPVRVVTMLDPADFRESILLSGGGDGVVRVHVGPHLRPIQNFKARSGVGVAAMRVAPPHHGPSAGAGIITIAYRDGTIAHWDMVAGTLHWRFTAGELSRSGSLDGITLGARLVAAWGSTALRAPVPIPPALTPPLGVSTPSPQVPVALPASVPEYVVRVHDLVDRGRSGPPPLVATLGGHPRRITCASLCESRCGDSPLAVTGSADGYVRVWDLNRCGSPGGSGIASPQATLPGHTGSIIQAELCGGFMLLSAAKDRSVRVWDLRQPPETAAIRRIPHPDKLTAVAARLDVPSVVAPLLVTATEDAAIRTFDLRAGTPLAHLVGAVQSPATALALAPFDAAVGCKDGSIRWLTFD
eukprot:tig00020563_g11355.t1